MDVESPIAEPIQGPFAKIVRLLASKRGDLTRLKTDAWVLGVRGTSQGAFDSAVAGRGEPPVPLMESVAIALGIDPMVFDEYRCFVARQRLTPGIVGREEATTNADLVLSQTRETAAEVAAAEARRHEVTHPPGGGTRRGSPRTDPGA